MAELSNRPDPTLVQLSRLLSLLRVPPQTPFAGHPAGRTPRNPPHFTVPKTATAKAELSPLRSILV